jgi:hypothetical protein
MSKFWILIIAICFLNACKNNVSAPILSNDDVTKVTNQMTEIMVHDITNPPLAARFFAYTCLAGYTVMAQNDSLLKPMKGILNEYPDIPKPTIEGAYSPHLAAILAMMATAKKMQPSGKIFDDFEKKYLDSCQNIGFSKENIENSKQYAQSVSNAILAYAKADGYNRISNFPRYTPLSAKSTITQGVTVSEGSWYPTPPGYMTAVEPYFNTIRSFTLDSAGQFKPPPPIAFSKEKNSAFYQLMQAVYIQKLPAEHQEIAAFWDCNPFALQDNGHLLVGMKKISPGAHWMGIAGIACAKNKADFCKTLQIHTLLAICLMDGFLCCWDEKYRSNRIRPETAIRKYIDPNWKPFLQTPPFPEYLSGHSTISAAAATILSHFFGENYAYEDTVEMRYGLPARSYQSFKQAAEEAGISRFYGGIHFMDAITNGQKQGESVATHIIQKYTE